MKPSSGAVPTVVSESPCPCGSGQPFGQCCEPALRGERLPATAETLMRSRFTAHVVRDFRYLHRTYLATAKRPYAPEENEDPDITWTRMVVHAHELGPKPDTAYVDFTAYFQDGDAERALHEKSEFARIEGAWYYTRAVRTGPAPIKSTQPKVGRNEPCPCGSGRKYKQCCGR